MDRRSLCRHVILSGCSGGGKTTLLTELDRRGFDTVAEPGRRIVAQEMFGNGKALPWIDLEAFALRAIDMANTDREINAAAKDWVFFDRGLVDAAVALEHATGIKISETLSGRARFHRQVFLTPPWPEIFRNDAERRHTLDEAVAEYHRLHAAFAALGYDILVLPKTDVAKRADFVLKSLPSYPL
ncbi:MULTISPECIES: AAA family ATPase [unclassified Yoonia]|uniref:AAA family ATPase n=1 Tax=unclassified Yoonia TaxID=2629118 RepID=UPI002AFFFC79|nr:MULTISPECIES: AAA family ATPase [unclassified Yoonia]